MSAIALLLIGIRMMAFCPFDGNVGAQSPANDKENDGSEDNLLSIHIEFPLIEYSDDFSDITGGIGWDIRYDLPVTRFGEKVLTSGLLTSDGAVGIMTAGAWLLDEAMNQKPLKGQLSWDFGFELQPRIISRPPPGLFVGDVEISDIGFWNWLYNYRFAFALEAGVETVQSFDIAYFSVGPGLRIINMEHTGWKGLLPTLAIFYEGMFELKNEGVEASVFNSEFSRFRLIQRHYFGFGWLGLTDLSLVGGYQYTLDFGQSREYKEEGFDRRLGWFVDLSYAIRWSDRQDEARRIDLFTQFTSGRIAPLIEKEEAFFVGIRIPYSLAVFK